eukprot:2014023-Alexandrium_andersonii.AAC.1
MLHWRVAVIPKHSATPEQRGPQAAPSPTPVHKVRPISVGCAVYRCWASIRVQQAATWMSSKLAFRQGGGKGALSAESLLA